MLGDFGSLTGAWAWVVIGIGLEGLLLVGRLSCDGLFERENSRLTLPLMAALESFRSRRTRLMPDAFCDGGLESADIDPAADTFEYMDTFSEARRLGARNPNPPLPDSADDAATAACRVVGVPCRSTDDTDGACSELLSPAAFELPIPLLPITGFIFGVSAMMASVFQRSG
ncbi:hypothetical protein BX661DRAFT_170916 [Kickxella alabastrina]|uniref:uncharacterized protein n=1 Tax=Kickxella alabastrina TaxID=61397 RepID=UPI0022209B53|nr:uncharacterized protein BX661DRAFT_170916 [Kickxella alabastrina]KAI7828498.1 hypothetical protein BX661DRAFT_170916 [Kickxella alabastrina]